VAALLGTVLLIAGGTAREIGLVLVLVYAAALALSGIHAAIRFRSLVVGALEPPAVVASQGAYLVGFGAGLMSSFAIRSESRSFQSKRRA
jgi:hypothetical protein